MLNKIWFWLIISSIAAAFGQAIFIGSAEVINSLGAALFSSAKLAVEIALGLIGVLCLWQGVFAIAEQAGIVNKLALGLGPLFKVLMPEIPKGDKAIGSVTMNLAANALGLDNAATPLGIKAMQDLQRLNPTPHIASNAQILFLVLNTSSVTLIPVTVFLYRAQQGAAAPADVFLPILLATSASTFAGLLLVCAFQKINLLQRVTLFYFAAAGVFILGLLAYLTQLSAQVLSAQSTIMANSILLGFIALVLLTAANKKVAVYDVFVEGAKQGFETAIKLIPFLLAMLLALALLRESGILNVIIGAVRWLVLLFNGNTEFVDALPVAITKPFSGSAARALLIDIMNVHGADSFAGRLASIMQGSTETTFYVLAVYFGAVGIRKTRHALICGLFADFAGMVAAILVAYWFYF